jgi:hypothetical protein
MATTAGIIREVRETATSMREEHGASHPRHEMWYALADFLEEQARFLSTESHFALDPKLMTVVRAYQAARTRPDIDGSV